ncbi:hypothetical protein Tco_0571324 [Tanacetum coccineum]
MKWVLCVQWLRLAVTGLGLGLQSLHSLCQLHTNGLLKMVCVARLGLLSFIAAERTWDEFVVSAQCFPSNPSLPLASYDDDDEESSIPLSDVISELPPCVAITPVLSTEEPDNSLSMGDEHLDTILATESDEVIKSSVEGHCLNLYQASRRVFSLEEVRGYSPGSWKSSEDDKNSGSTTIYAEISLPDLECVYFKSEPDPGDLTYIDPEIHENVSSTTNVNLPFEDDQSPLFAYVDCLDFEASRAHGFVLRSLELHSPQFILESQYPKFLSTKFILVHTF